jgi:transcriptional regulator with XRE-family HTH domain
MEQKYGIYLLPMHDFIEILICDLLRNFAIFFIPLPNIFKLSFMNNKEKLIEMRNLRGFTQKDIAEKLNMEVSGYSRRETGDTKIRINEWMKLAKILNVPLEDIYEEDEKQSLNFNDNATGNYGANNINHLYITVPEAFMETQMKYIQKLEEEIAELKLLKKK